MFQPSHHWPSTVSPVLCLARLCNQLYENGIEKLWLPVRVRPLRALQRVARDAPPVVPGAGQPWFEVKSMVHDHTDTIAMTLLWLSMIKWTTKNVIYVDYGWYLTVIFVVIVYYRGSSLEPISIIMFRLVEQKCAIMIEQRILGFDISAWKMIIRWG